MCVIAKQYTVGNAPDLNYLTINLTFPLRILLNLLFHRSSPRGSSPVGRQSGGGGRMYGAESPKGIITNFVRQTVRQAYYQGS